MFLMRSHRFHVGTRKQLKKRGIAEAMYDVYTPGEKDYSALIFKMQAADIDVVYIGGYSTEAGLILRQGRYQGFEAQFVSGDALTNDEFWMITGPAGEGTLVTFGPDPRANAGAAAVVRRFRDQGFEPLGYTLHTYAAVQAWAQAVRKAGALDISAVIKALRSYEFDTVLGKIGFDLKGDVNTSGYVWYVWKDGEYVLAQ